MSGVRPHSSRNPGGGQTTTRRASTPRPRGATLPLLLFAAVYMSPLVLAPSLWVVAVSIGLGALVAGGAWVIARRIRVAVRTPNAAELRAVRVTSVFEGVAVLVALGIGMIAGMWWVALPLVLTSVTVHVFSLWIALRRPVDVWCVCWAIAATSATWLLSASFATSVWPPAGAVAAGVCIGYVLALHSVRRGQTPPSPALDVSVQGSASPTA